MKQYISSIFLLLMCFGVSAQVGINTPTPHPSAVLDLTSSTNNKGFLPPRLTTAQRDAIASPAIGLVIYNTTTNCLNFYANTGWKEICGTAVAVTGTLVCANAVNTGTLTSGVAASSVSSSVPYTGGNGGTHVGQTVTSTGVAGLTATLAAGVFATGAGSLVYNITGTPGSNGIASFALNIGGLMCTLTRTVISNPATAIVEVTNPATGKIWMDRNLGANRAATSSADTESYGSLFQWGRDDDGHQFVNRFVADGVTTSNTTGAQSAIDRPVHDDFIIGFTDWRSPQNDNLWQGLSGINNPCPSGYRVPTEVELNAERTSWSSNNAAGAFASPLKLPVAGRRADNTGLLGNVGTLGEYWSSTVSGASARGLAFNSSIALVQSYSRAIGFSVRCLKDVGPAGAIGTVNCAGATNSGTLTIDAAASAVSSSVPYTVGNGGSHAGQTVTSTGVTGLTAYLFPGVFATGAGSVVYTITGTPGSSGTASFALNIGGQTCTLTRTVNLPVGVITALTCASATNAGTLTSGVVASGISSSVPYTGGNGGSHAGQTVTSTGVTGLTATLAAGAFATGAGSLVYNITGTPTTSGTASFALNIGGQTCTLTRTVAAAPGAITTINCAGATPTGTLTSGVVASAVSSSVPYTGGNGGTHGGQTVTSTGVTGLTATLAAGSFVSGAGSLVYTITGTPGSSGTASFALNIGGETCTLTRTVAAPAFACGTSTVTFTYNGNSVTYGTVGSTGNKCWLDRNLGATQIANSSTDANSYGDLFQWGRGADGHQVRNPLSGTINTQSAMDNPGHDDFIIGFTDWRSPQNNNLWQGVSGINNPCPSGYRVPTEAELDAERASWSSNNAAGAFASPLKLPMAGSRDNTSGSLFDVGTRGFYWMSANTSTSASNIFFNSTDAFVGTRGRATGVSVRCLRDNGTAGAIGSINCGGATNNGTLTSGVAASGASSSVPYTGGNGGPHGGQTVTSTGVTGLTATLAAGSFANGAGTLVYNITGTPGSSGTASFALNIGGQTCTMTRTVSAGAGAITTITCASATNTGTLTSGAAASGVSSSVPYTGGNGGTHSGQTVTSTGVTGLTATLAAGSFVSGAGTLVYNITGTPGSSGTASFALNIGGQTCTMTRTVSVAAGAITTITCASATNNGTLTSGVAASGASSSVPYTGGNGGTHGGQTVTSTGVTGLTATLTAGSFVSGAGSLVYNITGTPGSSGTASFALNIGGQMCTLTRTVAAPTVPNICNPSNPTAIVEVTNSTTGKIWMDRNLGANRAATSSTDAQSYGSMFQWGRGADGHQCVNRYAGDGVTTSGTTSTLSSTDNPGNGNFILAPSDPYDWRSPQNGSLWQGVSGTNNPCPSGYRLPTEAELAAERASWSSNGAAGAFASPLKLPLTGRRGGGGSVFLQDTYGNYWSSTLSEGDPRYLDLESSDANLYTQFRSLGMSVRCLKN